MTVVLERHQIEEGFDSFDTLSVSLAGATTPLVTWSSDGYAVDPLLVPSSSISVNFKSNAAIEYSGFTLAWYSNSLCPKECMNNGWCIAGSCVCKSGWNGPDCSFEQASYAQPVTPGVVYYGIAADFHTRLYKVQVPANVARLQLNYSRVSLPELPYAHWGGGHPQFAIIHEAIPTRLNVPWKNYFEPVIEEVSPAPGTWYIGVYGLETASYAISVLPFVELPTTVPAITASQISTNQLSVPGLVVGLVIIIASFVALFAVVGGYVWWRRYKGTNFRSMNEEHTEQRSEATELEHRPTPNVDNTPASTTAVSLEE